MCGAARARTRGGGRPHRGHSGSRAVQTARSRYRRLPAPPRDARITGQQPGPPVLPVAPVTPVTPDILLAGCSACAGGAAARLVPVARLAPLTPLVLVGPGRFCITEIYRFNLVRLRRSHPGSLWSRPSRESIPSRRYNQYRLAGGTTCSETLGESCYAGISGTGRSRRRDRRWIASRSSASPSSAEAKAAGAPIRVGGNVQAANLINQPKPAYPPLAKARAFRVRSVSGCDLRRTHHRESSVVERPSAAGSVGDGQCGMGYKPTLLNGEPVEVITTIDVNFTLSQ